MSDAHTEEPGEPVDATAMAELPTSRLLKEKLGFLREARRQLKAEELASPVVSRFLIEEIERLDEEATNLRSFRDRYYEADKEVALLRQEKLNTQSLNLKDAAILAAGSAGLGAAPAYIEISQLGWVFVVISAVLVVISFVKRKS